MRKLFPFLMIFLVIACSSTRSRKNIAYSEVVIKGGVFNNQEWRDKLIFDRTSWFQGATMDYDILIHYLKKDSKFAPWLGSGVNLLEKCNKLYIALLYTDFNSIQKTSFLVEQVEKLGYKEVALPDFKENLKAHDNFQDWRLSHYKVLGFCQETDESQQLIISMPGFKSTKI